MDSELWVKGCCLAPLGACWNLEASFPSYSTEGPRGPWLDTEDLPWAPTLEDESVTLSPTESESRAGQAGLSPFPCCSVSQPCWSSERVGNTGTGILEPDPLWEALLASATRESSKEVLGALLTEWVVYLY